jgi:hypothetical protein
MSALNFRVRRDFEGDSVTATDGNFANLNAKSAVVESLTVINLNPNTFHIPLSGLLVPPPGSASVYLDVIQPPIGHTPVALTPGSFIDVTILGNAVVFSITDTSDPMSWNQVIDYSANGNVAPIVIDFTGTPVQDVATGISNQTIMVSTNLGNPNALPGSAIGLAMYNNGLLFIYPSASAVYSTPTKGWPAGNNLIQQFTMLHISI